MRAYAHKMFQVTTPKEELTLWQARPMEIVSRLFLALSILLLLSILTRLIKSELKLGKRVVSAQASKLNMFNRKRSQSTYEDE